MFYEEGIIPITNDVMFKALFVNNPDLLKSFLSAALGIEENRIKRITIRNPELPPIYYGGSLSEDEKIREYVRQREKAEQDYRADIVHAEAKGAAKEREKMIARWKVQGKTDEEIAELLADD